MIKNHESGKLEMVIAHRGGMAHPTTTAPEKDSDVYTMKPPNDDAFRIYPSLNNIIIQLIGKWKDVSMRGRWKTDRQVDR